MPKPLITQYRPSSFDEVWGHKEEVRSIQQNLQADTSRVFLFIGPSGIGKTTCARLIGQFHDAAIQEVDAGKYSGIDDCRDLTDSLRYHPIDGRKRCIIMNECFVGETLVLTTRGYKPIKEIGIGTYVRTALGWHKVTNTFQNKVKKRDIITLLLNTGKIINCSRNHLFLTDAGWVPAASLKVKSRLINNHESISPELYKLWNQLYEQGPKSTPLFTLSDESLHSLWGMLHPQSIFRQATNLFQILWKYCGESKTEGSPLLARKEATDIKKQSTVVAIDNGACFPSKNCEKDERKQSRISPRNHGKNHKNKRIPGNFTCMGWHTWRQWPDNYAARAFSQIVESVYRLQDGVFYLNIFGWGRYAGVGVSKSLHNGYSYSSISLSDRNRRKKPFVKKQAITRSEEGCQTTGTWVVGIEDYQSRNRSECFIGNSADNSADKDFEILYDLEIDQDHSYCVEGAIVHNCQALSKKAWDSLLMHIEEPPDYLIWVFTTTEPGKVPETIKTRSTVYQLKPLATNDLIDLLEAVCEAEQVKPAQGVVDLCARSASGSPRAALSNLALCLGAETRQEAARLLEEADEPTDAIELIRALVSGKQWDTIQPILSKLSETNPETIRHVCRAYLTKAILGTKDGGKVASYLGMLEHFSTPFLNSDQLTPVVMAVGRILFAEEEPPF